ncbi:serine protease [Roseovarius aestuariivivens]|uniref:serine protease n=1 Tax=Roseovarius aestuariivivens TaxID=1888910 RepID=UPI00108030E6|nr:serine protease [Roseovarius aestuariivivens]
MTRIFMSLLFIVFAGALPAAAQQSVFIQIEAQPSLARAEDSLRRYALEVQDVNGFALGGGWYGIALGPYDEDEAPGILRNLRAARLIPRDSYIAQPSEYQRQFWPVGTDLLAAIESGQTSDAAQSEARSSQARTERVDPAPEATADPEPVLVDETPREARASEARLTREERAALQVALKWAGFYGGAIDAAFGRGTRGSMARWQEANSFEPTGVLTTRQRAELLRQYNAVLDGLGLRVVRDTEAGIEMRMPMDVVSFDRYEAPFAHYTATGNIEARVLLISQEGDRATLAGLYDIMQTLEIVPETGPRTIQGDAFTLIGEGAYFISHTQAWLRNGEVKGFTLIWPAGDEERRTRLLGEMQESFTRLDGTLDPTAGADREQSINLVAGLEIRKPKISRSGFYVDRAGTVVTTSEVVQGCSRITLDDAYDATVQAVDEEAGIAVLRPVDPLAPLAVAAFGEAVPRLKADIAVAGYSYGGVLSAPTVTFGQLEDVQGLQGEESLKRLALSALEGDAGGPVVDAGGAVVGMLLPAQSNGRRLPDGVSFAANAETIRAVLEAAGVRSAASTGGDLLKPEALTQRATGMTVLVSCWD